MRDFKLSVILFRLGCPQWHAEYPAHLSLSGLWTYTTRRDITTFKGFKLSHYSQRYLAEFQYRFNRRFDLRAILIGLLADAIRSAPWREVSLRQRMPAEIGA